MHRRIKQLEGRAPRAPRKLSPEERAERARQLERIQAQIRADPVGEANRQAALEDLLYYTQYRL